MKQSTLEWIDSHCHLDALEFDPEPDRMRMREQARSLGVRHCILPAVERANFLTVQALAHRLGDYYALGIHPLFTPGAQEEDLSNLDQLLTQSATDLSLVALGEVGLDGLVAGLDWSRQMHFYRAQLKLAKKHDLPLILHVRRSSDALLKGLRDVGVRGGIAHAFNGSLVQAQHFVDMGFCLGFGGALTYERALHLRRLLINIPITSIVLETDAPDIPPHWLYVRASARAMGVKPTRNSPTELPRIAQVVAELKGVSLEELSEQSCQNVRRVFPRMGLQ
jgi:TatD DNase family protein